MVTARAVVTIIILGVASIALHASGNIAQRLKRLETIQVIEHSTMVNACKNSGNSDNACKNSGNSCC